MMSSEGKYKELVARSLQQALHHLSEENYGRSFANYLVVLRLSEEEKSSEKNYEDIIDNFVFALGQWGQQLENRSKIKELFDCYERALELLPTNEQLLVNFGAHLLRLDCYNEAATYLRRALAVNPTSVTARECLDTVSNALVERWHFSMLNCVQRNTVFKNGINKAISDGRDVVLDIGSGTGILSMFAVQSGAKRVHACEISQTMFGIAKETLSSNGMMDDVQLLNEKSTSLSIPEHLPERVSLVITETFDACLFGENILQTLVHAWDNILLPVSTNKGTGGAVLPKSATVWAFFIESEQIRKYSRLLPSSSQLWNVPSKSCIAEWTDTDPYTTERLSELRGGYRTMCNPVKILDVDFNDVKQLRLLLEGYEIGIPVRCEADGKLDAVVVYFDLHVTDTETISNGPNDTTCWEQAIFPSVDHNDTICLQGQRVSLDVFCCGGLQVKFTVVSDAHTRQTACDGRTATLRSVDILKLNDELFQSSLKMAFDEVIRDRQSINLSIMSNLPMLMAYTCSISNITNVGCTEETYDLAKKLTLENVLNTDKLVTMASSTTYDELEWNVIVADVVEPFGLINAETVKELALLLSSARLQSCFVVIPGKLMCVAVLIESEVLSERNRVVNDDRTLGLSIGQHINSYSVSLQQDIDLNLLQHKRLSKETTVLEMDFMEPISTADRIPSFLEANSISPIVVGAVGKITAIAFWFQLELTKQVQLSTADLRCHWNQAAFVLSEPLHVVPEQTVKLNANCNRGHLNLFLT